MRTARCVLYGGPHDGKTVHPPEGARRHVEAGTVYLRSERQDNENRQVYTLKIGRCIYDLPKQRDQ